MKYKDFFILYLIYYTKTYTVTNETPHRLNSLAFRCQIFTTHSFLSNTFTSLHAAPNPHDADHVRPTANTGHIIEKNQVAYIGLDSLSDGIVGSTIGSILLADLAAVADNKALRIDQ